MVNYLINILFIHFFINIRYFFSEEQRVNMRSENKLNYGNYNNSKFVISKEAAIIRNEKLLKVNFFV